MYAIVEIAGQQFKVAQDQKVFVHRLPGNEGDSVTFSKVMLLDNGTITLGAPVIEGAAVVAKILSHVKGDKVIVFKKKRRKGYRKKNGHRQFFSQIQIERIMADGFKEEKKETKTKTKAPKVEAEVVETASKTVKKAAPKKKADVVTEEKAKPVKKPAVKKTTKTKE